MSILQFRRWKGTSKVEDPRIIVRETSPDEVRRRFEYLLPLIKEAKLQEELRYEEPVSIKRHSSLFDGLAVKICRDLHPDPNFERINDFSRCPTCKRKYSLPWVKSKDPEAYVYQEVV